MNKALAFVLCVAAPLCTLPCAAQSHPQKSVRLAICQILVIDSDREGNFRRIEDALEEAQSQHAQIAVFRESSILGWENPDAHRLAEPIPGKTATESPLSRANMAS